VETEGASSCSREGEEEEEKGGEEATHLISNAKLSYKEGALPLPMEFVWRRGGGNFPSRYSAQVGGSITNAVNLILRIFLYNFFNMMMSS
jgi:hypothetical protein